MPHHAIVFVIYYLLSKLKVVRAYFTSKKASSLPLTLLSDVLALPSYWKERPSLLCIFYVSFLL